MRFAHQPRNHEDLDLAKEIGITLRSLGRKKFDRDGQFRSGVDVTQLQWTASKGGRRGKTHGDWFSVAVAGFPEVHPRAVSREADLRYLKEKVDAGADAVITQLFFDNDDYYRYVEDVRRLGVTVPIVPGVLPIQSTAQTRRFTAMCGSAIPSKLEPLLVKVETDPESALQLGIDYATEQCEALIRFGVPGIHFYSLNKARSVMAISKSLSLTAPA